MSGRAILAWIGLHLVALALPGPAWACSCGWLRDVGFIRTSDGPFPSNARGVLWWGELPDDPALHASAVRIRAIHGGEEVDVDAEFEWVGEFDRRGLWLVRAAGGFEAGRTYALTTRRVTSSGETFGEPQRLVIETTKHPIRPRDRTARLRVRKSSEDRVQVATYAGSCFEAPLAVQVEIEMELPTEVEPFRDQLYYETTIEGSEPWTPTRNLCAAVVPGVSWVGSARDRIYVLCEEGRPIRGPSLAEGTHRVSMRASLPGTDFEITTPAETIELRCQGRRD